MMDPSLCNFTPMDPLNATDFSPCTCRLSSLACLTSARSALIAFLPVLFGTGAAVLLQMQSVCRTQYIHRRWVTRWGVLRCNPSHRTLKSISTCANFEMYVYLHFHSFNLNFRYMATCKQTDIHTRLAMQSCFCGAHSGSLQLCSKFCKLLQLRKCTIIVLKPTRSDIHSFFHIKMQYTTSLQVEQE